MSTPMCTPAGLPSPTLLPTTPRGVVLATSRPELCARYQDTLADAELVLCTDTDAPDTDHSADVAAITASAPGVVVLDGWAGTEPTMRLARACRAAQPDCAIVVLAPPELGLLQAALRLGACDVVDPAAGRAELWAAVDRLAAAVRPELGYGATIAVLASKGGSGKTTVSVNLAVALATVHPDEVVLVDADLQFGDCATVLGLAPEHSSLDALGALARHETLKLSLTRHPSGLALLAAPEHPALADQLDAAASQALLTQLRRDFPYVVIDTAAGMDEHTLASITLADELVMLASTDVTSVRNARKSLDALDAIGATHQRRQLVVNRAEPDAGLSVADVEAALGLEAVAVLPASREVLLAGNRGTPLVLDAPTHPAARAVLGLAASFTPVALSAPKRRWRR